MQELQHGQVHAWHHLDFFGSNRLAAMHGLPKGCASSNSEVVDLVLEKTSCPNVRLPAS